MATPLDQYHVGNTVGEYKIRRQINSRAFRVTRRGHTGQYVMRIITPGKTKYAMRGIVVEGELERTIRLTKMFSDLGFGPQYVEHYWLDNGVLVLIIEHVKYSLLEKIADDYDEIVENIDVQIELMHAAGIIHGDLLEFNIRLDDANRVYFVSVDTAWLIGEDSLFITEWMQQAHKITDPVAFIAYEKQLYKSALVEDELDISMGNHLQDKSGEVDDNDVGLTVDDIEDDIDFAWLNE